MPDTVGINVVFTDLVGSTELSSRLGPEATELLRVVHFGLLRTAIEPFEGREVKNLGDGLMITFPSLGKSLDGSIAMQQAIERHNATGKEPLGVRVGISTGDATEEDDDFFGEPVVEAARLCAKCDAGQIIISQLTSMLARSSGHTFTSIGDLELRGIEVPVPSFTVDWEPAASDAAIGLPDRLVPDMEQQIAGRVRETDALAQAWKSAAAGEPRITLLAGEPGIGKTRLSAELATAAHQAGATVLYGRCDEEFSVPYQPWVEAISYLTDKLDDATLESVITSHGPELALMFPQLRRRFPDISASSTTDAETERYMLLQAITSTLSLVAEEAPVLVVLDDLHWAGQQTLTLLRHVFTNISAGSPVMIVGTYRDSDLDAGNPLIDTVAALRRQPGVELVPVQGLDDLEMRELVENSGGQKLDEAGQRTALLLRQETAGNPFFAHEILRNLVETGDLYLDGDRWVMKHSFDELALPQSVRDVVAQRIARLGEEPLKALTAAAVIGRDFDLALVATITSGDEDDLLDHFEAAVAAGVLAEVAGGNERFRFVHSVARTTLVAGLSDGRARRMHRKIAEALETAIGADPGDRVGELATHWMAASVPVDQGKAIHFAQLAGRRALVALAPDEAIRWFTTAVEHLDLADSTDAGLRAELLVELGTAQQHIGDPAYRKTLLDAGELAATVGITHLMVGAALANNRGVYSKLGQTDDERVAALKAALSAVGDADSTERALLLSTLFSELEWESPFHERTEMITEAIRMARVLDDRWVLASVLNRACVSSPAPHNLADRLVQSAESVDLAKALGDRTLEFWAHCGAFNAALNGANRAATDRALVEATKLADELGRPSFRWYVGILRTTLLTAVGHPDEADASATEAFEIGTAAGEPDAFDFYAAAVMGIRWRQGRSLEIVDLLRQAAEDNPEVPAYRSGLAGLLAEEGQITEAGEMLADQATTGFDSRVNSQWAQTVGTWARVATLVGDAESAAALYELISPWCGQLASTRASAQLLMDSYAAQIAISLGNYDQAEAHLADAERITTALGAHGWAADIDLDRAELQRAKGDEDAARAFAERAIEGAQASGYGGVERLARQFLEALGERTT
jgi:class 3 adenylate cyclase/tetratricopeptide (TPR) repeat protein